MNKQKRLQIFNFFLVVCILLQWEHRVSAVTAGELLAAGACEEFEAAPEPCIAVMVGAWSSVWTAPAYGLSQEYFNALMLAPVKEEPGIFVSLLDVIPTLSVRCAKAYSSLFCPTFFQPCSTVPNPLDPSTNLSVPIPVCRSVCENVNTMCGSPLVDCNQTNPLTGLPRWPDTACTVNDQFDDPISYPCPHPLIYVGPHETDPYTNKPCSSTCWTKLHFGTTEQKYQDLFIALGVFGWVSLISSVLTIIVFSVFPTLREYPTRLVLFTAIGTFFASLGFAGNVVQDIEQVMCGDDIYFQQQGWCRFSGWCVFFGGMLTATWWVIQAFVLFYNVGLQQHRARLDKKYEWVFHIWGWGWPIVMSLILLFVPNEEQGGAVSSYPWCFSNSTVPGLWWALFYGVLMLYVLLVVFFIVVCLGRLVIMGGASTMSKKSMAPFFISIGCFGLWYLVAVIAVIAFRAYTWDISDQQKSEIISWYECVFTTADVWRNCEVWQQNYFFGWFLAVTIGLTGFVLFLLFVPFRQRTRHVISTSISNVREGRSFFDGISKSDRTSQRSGGSGIKSGSGSTD